MTVDNEQRIGQITEEVVQKRQGQTDFDVQVSGRGAQSTLSTVYDVAKRIDSSRYSSRKIADMPLGPLIYAVGPGDGTGGRV